MYNEDCLITTSRFSNNVIDLIYVDPPFCTGRSFTKNNFSFNDRWNGIDEYLEWIKPRLSEFYRILKTTGTIYIHCDWHVSHYLKVICDAIFGINNFINEIIWQRHSCHNDTKQGSKHFGRIHDVLLMYVKSSKYIWNQQYIPYDDKYTDKIYKHFEEGTHRRYALGDLSGPGGKSKRNPRYEFLGFIRYWRYNETKMNKLLLEEKIVQREDRLPRLKRYLDDMKGKPIQDIWNDINSKKDTQYPTQKPEDLLDRIISTSSNPDQLIYDPFAGSSTSGVVCLKLSRKWIGSEISIAACHHSISRLKSINSNVKLVPKNKVHNVDVLKDCMNNDLYEEFLENGED